MRMFDLHCDTPLWLYNQNQPLTKNSLHVDLEKVAPYDTYIQVGAVWAEKILGNETAWEHFLRVTEAFDKTVDALPDVVRVTDAAGIREAAESGKRAFLLAAEDARILNGYISRLDILYERGVRILTLGWKGVTCIGGSHDTDVPLTDFGRAVVRRCFELGIVPDVSHASRPVTAEVLQMGREAGKAVIASHSNSHGAYPHTRNLTDDEFRAVTELGGIAGISLVPFHLTDSDNGVPCTIRTVLDHIYHYLSIGGENSLCLGCDFDGIDELPEEIENVSDMVKVADALRADGMSEEMIDKIFFKNAYDFAQRSL